jgi:hypothetical protein
VGGAIHEGECMGAQKHNRRASVADGVHDTNTRTTRAWAHTTSEALGGARWVAYWSGGAGRKRGAQRTLPLPCTSGGKCCDAPCTSTCVPGSHRLRVHVGAAEPTRVPLIKSTNTRVGQRCPCHLQRERSVCVCGCVWRGGREGAFEKSSGVFSAD